MARSHWRLGSVCEAVADAVRKRPLFTPSEARLAVSRRLPAITRSFEIFRDFSLATLSLRTSDHGASDYSAVDSARARRLVDEGRRRTFFCVAVRVRPDIKHHKRRT